jgi:hypothetical protein
MWCGPWRELLEEKAEDLPRASFGSVLRIIGSLEAEPLVEGAEQCTRVIRSEGHDIDDAWWPHPSSEGLGEQCLPDTTQARLLSDDKPSDGAGRMTVVREQQATGGDPEAISSKQCSAATDVALNGVVEARFAHHRTKQIFDFGCELEEHLEVRVGRRSNVHGCSLPSRNPKGRSFATPYKRWKCLQERSRARSPR